MTDKANTEIERLKAHLHSAESDIIKGDKAILRMQEENARLREALEPFARAGELFGPRGPDDYDQCIYSPAAGPEYALRGDDLRKARSVLSELASALKENSHAE